MSDRTSNPHLYRNKPVEIEAYQLPPNDGLTRLLPPVWLLQAITKRKVFPLPEGGAEIQTLEGVMRAEVGDWVIRGVKGEIYSCKPDIFGDTYDKA